MQCPHVLIHGTSPSSPTSSLVVEFESLKLSEATRKTRAWFVDLYISCLLYLYKLVSQKSRVSGSVTQKLNQEVCKVKHQ